MKETTVKLAKLGIALAIGSFIIVSAASAQSPYQKIDPMDATPEDLKYDGPTPAECTLNAKIMHVARQFLGVKNNSGYNEDPDRNVPNPIIEEFAHSVFHANLPSEEFYGGWCSFFVTYVLEKCGIHDITETMYGELQMSKAHMVVAPMLGDIVLLRGHIAFYAGEDPSQDYIWILGGNQGFDNSESDGGSSGSGSGTSYYPSYGSAPNPGVKYHPFEVHGLELTRSQGLDRKSGSGGVDVHVDMPKDTSGKKGFGVNYAKVKRSDIQAVYRINPQS